MATITHSIQEDLKKILKPSRYQHVLGVCSCAKDLSRKYNCCSDKAEIAALLHDYAKGFSIEQQVHFFQQFISPLDQYQRKMPQLIHAPLARYFAHEKYQIQDDDILNAIEFHPCGRPGMSLLEKIICLADFIEPARNFPGVDQLREWAKKDLDVALYYALSGSISYLAASHSLIHPLIIEARNDLLFALSQSKKEGFFL